MANKRRYVRKAGAKGRFKNNELGQFKEEHINEDFKFIQAGQYQWGSECHYNGVPGCAIKDIENIENWQDNLPYKLVNRRIVKNG